MKVVIDNNIRIDEGTTISIGNFDGLHKGHKELINIMKKKAQELNTMSGVVSFYKHTTKTLSDNINSKVILSNDQKVESLKDMSIDMLYMIDFTKEVMILSPEEFVKKFLIQQLNVKSVVIGFNFRFGYNASGDTETLKELGKKYGFEVIVLDPIYYEENIISSTYIRNLINEGDLTKANLLLEKSYSLIGKVVKGKSRGKKLGFPTANLELDDDYIIPRKGIYKTKTIIEGKEYMSLTSVGSNPTFGYNDISIETYILDFSKDIYGENIEVCFIKYLRDEIKFSNEFELISQIKKDIQMTKESF